MSNSISTAKSDVSETVIVLLPFVAPAVMAGPVEGGGQGAYPRAVDRNGIRGYVKNRSPLSCALKVKLLLDAG